MAIFRFHCPECGLGDHEVGHHTREMQMHCIVCLEEEGRLIRLHCWEEEAITPSSGSPWRLERRQRPFSWEALFWRVSSRHQASLPDPGSFSAPP